MSAGIDKPVNQRDKKLLTDCFRVVTFNTNRRTNGQPNVPIGGYSNLDFCLEVE